VIGGLLCCKGPGTAAMQVHDKINPSIIASLVST